MSSFTGRVAQHTPPSHTSLIVCWYALLLFGDTSPRYIPTLAVITELQLCICTQYTVGAT